MVLPDHHNASSEEMTLNSLGETNEEANSSFEVTPHIKLKPECLPEGAPALGEDADPARHIEAILLEDIKIRAGETREGDLDALGGALRSWQVSSNHFWLETVRLKELAEEGYQLAEGDEDLADNEADQRGAEPAQRFLSFKRRLQNSLRQTGAAPRRGKENKAAGLGRLLKPDKEKVESSFFLRSGLQIHQENNKKLYKELKTCATQAGRRLIAQKFLRNVTRNFNESLGSLRNQHLPLRFQKPHEKMSQLLIDCLTKPETDELGLFNPKDIAEHLHKTAQMLQGPVLDAVSLFNTIQN